MGMMRHRVAIAVSMDLEQQEKKINLIITPNNQENKVSENKIPVLTAESIPQSCMDNLKKLADAISKWVKNMLEREIIQPKNEEEK